MKNGDKHILSGSSSVNMSTNMYENETLLTNRYLTTGSFDSQEYDYSHHPPNDFLPMDTSSFDESDYHTVKSQSQYHKPQPPQPLQQQERKSLQTLFPIMEQDDESRSRTDMSSINEKERSPDGKSPSSNNISIMNNNNTSKNHRNYKDNNPNNNSRPGSRSTTPIPHWK
jgi:hypothetical protein